jgi:hypothetical protein
MCNQADFVILQKAFDDALLKLFWEWAPLAAEYIDGDDVGPQDWDAEFLHHIADRLPELKKTRDYGRLTRLLDALAVAAPAAHTASSEPALIEFCLATHEARRCPDVPDDSSARRRETLDRMGERGPFHA